MTNVKLIDSAVWAALPVIDISEGDDLAVKGVSSDTYRCIRADVASAIVVQWSGTGVAGSGSTGVPSITAATGGQPSLSGTADGEMQIDGSGDISLTVTSPPEYAGGPYTVDQSAAATGNLNTTSIETGPQCAVLPAISRLSGASDTVGATYRRITGLWLYDGDDSPTFAGEWYLDDVATGQTGQDYTPDAAGAVEWRDSVTGAGVARAAISNEITVTASVPAQMGAPALTVVSDTEVSVDRAAAPSNGGSAITQYDLRYSTDQSTWTVVTDISDPEAVTGLAASTEYFIQTRAVNGVGAGVWSASAIATTQAAAGSGFELILGQAGFAAIGVGNNLLNDGWYTPGGWSNLLVADNSGTLVLNASGGSDPVEYDGNAVTINREMAAKIHQKSDAPGVVCQLYLFYKSSSDYLRAVIDAGGFVQWQERIAGSNTTSNAFNTGAAPKQGDVLRVRYDGTSATIHWDDGTTDAQVGSFSPTGTYAVTDYPAINLGTLGTTDKNQISQITIRDVV